MAPGSDGTKGNPAPFSTLGEKLELGQEATRVLPRPEGLSRDHVILDTPCSPTDASLRTWTVINRSLP